LFAIVQYFKFSVRDALQFGPYILTHDVIRYILLVIQFLALVICGVNLRGKAKLAPLSPRIVIAGAVYSIMLSAALTCVMLGQKAILMPGWKFYLTSKVVDPIAAVGSIAVLSLDWEEDGRVFAEKWVLLWVVGACTVVW